MGRSGGTVTEVQAASTSAAPRIAAAPFTENDEPMNVILLEALVALLLLVFIVWWTMFSGRKGGERRKERDEDTDQS